MATATIGGTPSTDQAWSVISQKGHVTIQANRPRTRNEISITPNSQGAAIYSPQAIDYLLENVKSVESSKGEFFFINSEGEKTYVDQNFVDQLFQEGMNRSCDFWFKKKMCLTDKKTDTFLMRPERGIAHVSPKEKEFALKVHKYVVGVD